MYLWTTSILRNLEKMTIGGTVGQWYFLSDPTLSMTADETFSNLSSAILYSFGTISVASLLQSITRLVNFVLKAAQKVSITTFTFYLNFKACFEWKSSEFCSNRCAKGRSVSDQGHGFHYPLLTHLCISQEWRLFEFLKKVTSTFTTQPCAWSFQLVPDKAHSWFRVLHIMSLLVYCKCVFFRTRGSVINIGWWIYEYRDLDGCSVFLNSADHQRGLEYVCILLLYDSYIIRIDATFVCYLIDLDMNACCSEYTHQVFDKAIY